VEVPNTVKLTVKKSLKELAIKVHVNTEHNVLVLFQSIMFIFVTGATAN